MKRLGLRGSFWPTASEEALLQSCLLPEGLARSAWRSLGSEIDIDRLPGEATRLLPLLGQGLRACGVSTPIMPRLRGTFRKTWLFNQILLAHASEIVTELGGAGIRSVVLKGCAVGVRYYEDVGLRPMGDIDIMVPTEEIGPAADRLARRGWTDVTDRRSEGERFRHRHDLHLIKSTDVECDLHWNVGEHLLLGPAADPTDRFWARAEGFELAGASSLALCPTDQLLHVIVHGAQPGSASRLQWIADAVMILRGAEIEWPRLEELAIRMRSTTRISDALSYLADTFEIPAEARGSVERLRRHPVPRSDRVEYALASGDVAIGGGMFPATFASYVRETRGWGLGKRVRLFPRYLQEVWDLEHASQVPGVALRKVRSTLRGGGAADPRG